MFRDGWRREPATILRRANEKRANVHGDALDGRTIRKTPAARDTLVWSEWRQSLYGTAEEFREIWLSGHAFSKVFAGAWIRAPFHRATSVRVFGRDGHREKEQTWPERKATIKMFARALPHSSCYELFFIRTNTPRSIEARLVDSLGQLISNGIRNCWQVRIVSIAIAEPQDARKSRSDLGSSAICRVSIVSEVLMRDIAHSWDEEEFESWESQSGNDFLAAVVATATTIRGVSCCLLRPSTWDAANETRGRKFCIWKNVLKNTPHSPHSSLSSSLPNVKESEVANRRFCDRARSKFGRHQRRSRVSRWLARWARLKKL